MDILTPYEFYTSICSLPNFSASKKYIPSEQSQFMQDCWSWVLPALLLVLHPPFFPRSFTGHPLFAHSLLPILRITWRFQLKPFLAFAIFICLYTIISLLYQGLKHPEVSAKMLSILKKNKEVRIVSYI